MSCSLYSRWLFRHVSKSGTRKNGKGDVPTVTHPLRCGMCIDFTTAKSRPLTSRKILVHFRMGCGLNLKHTPTQNHSVAASWKWALWYVMERTLDLQVMHSKLTRKLGAGQHGALDHPTVSHLIWALQIYDMPWWFWEMICHAIVVTACVLVFRVITILRWKMRVTVNTMKSIKIMFKLNF